MACVRLYRLSNANDGDCFRIKTKVVINGSISLKQNVAILES